MKQIIALLVLLAGTNGTIIAQSTISAADKEFSLDNFQAHRRFYIDLGQGNTMRIELVETQDLDLFNNMDSVIRTFLHDLQPLQDSLKNELASKRIDYATDSAGRRKIRLTIHEQKQASFLVEGDDVAALKLEQDTIHFVGTISFIAKYTLRRAFNSSRNYRISFFLNNLSDLDRYDDGSLTAKIKLLREDIASGNGNRTWNTTRQAGKAVFNPDPTISAYGPKGFVNAGNYLNFRISMDLQNYKNYFVPSASLGVGLIISNSFWKRELLLSWDPNFLFGRNLQGRLKTYRNDFITLTAGHGSIRDNDPTKESHLLAIVSFGYLVKRDGDFYEKNTFRFGGGRLSLFEGKTKIEPMIYFNNFFKGVTPGIRWIQSF